MHTTGPHSSRVYLPVSLSSDLQGLTLVSDYAFMGEMEKK